MYKERYRICGIYVLNKWLSCVSMLWSWPRCRTRTQKRFKKSRNGPGIQRFTNSHINDFGSKVQKKNLQGPYKSRPRRALVSFYCQILLWPILRFTVWGTHNVFVACQCNQVSHIYELNLSLQVYLTDYFKLWHIEHCYVSVVRAIRIVITYS